MAYRFGGNSLRSRCIRSGFVLGMGAIVARGLSFTSKVILARLLAPEALGLMVLILSLTALFEVLTSVGVKHSVIQNKNGAQPEYLNMAWWFQGLRGVGLYAVTFLAAPVLCRFYFAKRVGMLAGHTMPELQILMRVAFLAVLFNGLLSPRAHVLEKEFRFARSVLLIQGSSIVGTILIIVLAFIIRNVWAIAIGFAATAMLRCVFSYVLCPFVPRVSFDRDSFSALTRFARGMFGLPILAYLAFHGDVLVAGKLISTDLLGMYGMAFALAAIPTELFRLILGPVLLPAFAEKQDDKSTLCRSIMELTRVASLVIIPWISLAALCGGTILSVVYGKRFEAVAAAFAILCIYSFVMIQCTTLGAVFFGIGQPGKHRAFVGLRALILAVFIYPATKYFGLTGTVVVLSGASLIALGVQVLVMHSVIGLGICEYVICWLPGLALAVPVMIIVKILQGIKPDLPIQTLAAGAFMCVLVCLAGLHQFGYLRVFRRYQSKGYGIIDRIGLRRRYVADRG